VAAIGFEPTTEGFGFIVSNPLQKDYMNDAPFLSVFPGCRRQLLRAGS